MSDLRKAAEMALETLVKQHEWMVANDGMFQIPSRKAIETLRTALAMEKFSEVNQEIEEALAQPEYQTVSAPQPQTFTGQNPYTAPPKREWVGLPDEELPEGATYEFDRGVRWAEAKLKEKNT